MTARKPAAMEPERAAARLSGTVVVVGLAVGVGEELPEMPVLLVPDPEPTPPVLPAVEEAMPDAVPVGVASRELWEPGRPEPTPGLPPAREVGTLTLVLRVDALEPEPELVTAETELLLEELFGL